MASDASFAEYVCDQLHAAGRITRRKMFGEFAIYCNGKVVGFICGNRFFVKPTEVGLKLLGGQVSEAAPYPGARLYFVIDEQLDDQRLVSQLIRLTEEALPLPKPKKPRAPRSPAAAKKPRAG